METRDGATYFAGRVWGISTHYDLGDDHPLVGYSVPNFEWEDGATIGDLMHDGKGILLDFERNASLETLASEYSDRLKYVFRASERNAGLERRIGTSRWIRRLGFRQRTQYANPPASGGSLVCLMQAPSLTPNPSFACERGVGGERTDPSNH